MQRIGSRSNFGLVEEADKNESVALAFVERFVAAFNLYGYFESSGSHSRDKPKTPMAVKAIIAPHVLTAM